MMRRRKQMPLPQFEFGFTPSTFNLFQEKGIDGDRVLRERIETEKAREQSEAAQRQIFSGVPRRKKPAATGSINVSKGAETLTAPAQLRPGPATAL